MYISDETPVIENFRSAATEKLGLWVSIAGVMLLGIVSCFYTSILEMAKTSEIFFLH